MDAIYSPVRRMNWDVGYARVGQSTNYDKLLLEIWTDGTMGPEQALSTSAKLVIDHLRHIAGISEESLAAISLEEEQGSRLTSEMIETPMTAADALRDNLPTGEKGLRIVAKCIEGLVHDGRLTAQGDVKSWRHSEVKLPADAIE